MRCQIATDPNGAEIPASFKFRVRAANEMHFESFTDAKEYAESSLHADSIDLRLTETTWSLNWWQDAAEIKFNRPGFGVATFYKKVPA